MAKRSETCENGHGSRNTEKSVCLSGMAAAVTKKKKLPSSVQRIFRWVGKAVMRYDLLYDGDRIVVGVSGVDSLSMLWLLRERLAWVPVTYTLKAVYIDLGFDDAQRELIERYLKDEAYDYSVIRTSIGLAAHSEENRKNPCFYCAWQRRKKLFQLCRELGFNKIALGHHLEDINATFFINILFGGSVGTMVPRQKFFGGAVTIIRPLALVYKEQLRSLAEFLHLPLVDNPCPSAKTSQRKEVEKFLQHFYRKDRRIRYSVFNAFNNIHPEYVPEDMERGEE